MSQDPQQAPSPVGVVYNTSMARPDAALALAALHVSVSRREARVDGICITGSGLDAAVFCDIVARFYSGQARVPSSNAVLPIGFPADPPRPPDPPMVETAVRRTRADGEPQYARSIQRVTDTAAPDALLRNAVTFSAETVVLLSAPATWLARSLALAGTPAQYKQRVKRVVIVDAGDLDRDRAAMDALAAALPAPPIVCGREVGEALSVPRPRLDGALAWAPSNPVADAMAASGRAPVPLHDLAALHFALHPESGFFSESDGRLSLDPSKRDACLDELLSLATAKPEPPPARRR